MCAAPGSKTAQLIEMLHATETDSQPGGIISLVHYKVMLGYGKGIRPVKSWVLFCCW